MFEFFKRKNSNSQFQTDLKYAKQIVEQIGVKSSYWNVNLSRGGRNVETSVYDGYGLYIKYDDGYRSMTICFNNTVVLQYTYEEFRRDIIRTVYYPGNWETVLIELYRKLPVLSYEKEAKENIINHKFELLNKIRISRPSNSILRIFDMKLDKTDNYVGYENEHYEGTYYRLYYRDELVFKGFTSTYKDHKVFTYIPGDWEEKLDLCISYEKDLKEEAKKKEEEKLINDSLRRIREL